MTADWERKLGLANLASKEGSIPPIQAIMRPLVHLQEHGHESYLANQPRPGPRSNAERRLGDGGPGPGVLRSGRLVGATGMVEGQTWKTVTGGHRSRSGRTPPSLALRVTGDYTQRAPAADACRSMPAVTGPGSRCRIAGKMDSGREPWDAVAGLRAGPRIGLLDRSLARGTLAANFHGTVPGRSAGLQVGNQTSGA